MIESRGTDSNRPVHGRGRVAWRRLTLWLVLAAGVLVLALGAWFAFSTSAGDRAAMGVRLEDMDASRLTRPQILAQIQGWAAPRKTRKIALSVQGTPLVFDPEAVGLELDSEASVQRVLRVGRGGSFWRRWAEVFKRCVRPELVMIAIKWDAARLSLAFDEWERTIRDAPFAGDIAVQGTTVAPLYPRAGARLDRAEATRQLLAWFRVGKAEGSLATRRERPAVERAEVDRVRALAESMLSGDVELVTADQAHRLKITPSELGALLRVRVDAAHHRLELECAPEQTHRLLDPVRSELEHPAQNARFVIDAQDHVHVEAGHAGVILDDQALARALCTAAQNPGKKGDLPLSPGAEPVLTTDAAEHAGVLGLVGAYTTRHACCQPRVQNIHHIADLIDGTWVRPGETFSVNQLVGPRTIKNGFRPAPSIEDGDMIDTVGGGVSQFATTLFNALFKGGYDILERQPHSYWFTRYPMGYDATLSYPHPDIVFKNDTAAFALIKAEYTETAITVKVYGDNGGRRVRAEVSERQSIVPPPVEFIPNSRLDTDQEKTREGGMIGWSVIVKRTVTFADGKIKEERRKVTYKPRARRVEVHPCRIPEGEPGHTGERCPVPEKDTPEDAPEDAPPSAPSDAGAK